MSRAVTGAGSHAPRPSRRRGGRIRLQMEQEVIHAAPIAGALMAAMNGHVHATAMTDGYVAARDGAVRSVTLEAGSISGLVQSEADGSLKVSITFPTLEDDAWRRVVEAASCEAIWAAKLLEEELPPGMLDLCVGCAAPLIPAGEDLSITGNRSRSPEPWRIAALAWVAAEQLCRKPLRILEMRGLSHEQLLERIRHHRSLRSQGEAVAHPLASIGRAQAEGAPLGELIDSWWRQRSHAHDVDRESYVPHALLRRLGPSLLEGRFPLSGLLATIYDDVASEAGQILDAPTEYPVEPETDSELDQA
ncbi:MAG: hypothetical protein MK077_05495 [Phycisphaerales bacterium]|nr:hypothetical protein [Phycisphaerales bacterium]